MVRPHSSPPKSAMQPTGDNYVWIGPGGGAWGTSGNWRDTTTGTTGVSAPGRGAGVAIAGGVGEQGFTALQGGGSAASLTVTNQVSLLGDYRFGALNVDGFATTLELGSADAGARATVRVSSLQVAGPGGFLTGLDVVQSRLFVSGRLSLQGTFAATSGADVRIGSLVMTDPDFLSGYIVSVDSTSTFEIGSAGGAAAGFITVDAGASLSGSGTLEAAIVNRGTIIADGFLVASDAVSGSGVLQINARSDLVVGSAVSGQTIDFAGPEGRLDVRGFSSAVNGPGWLASDTTITGFTAGDILAFQDSIVSATISSISGGEELTLTGVDGQEEQLILRGATTATRYLIVSDYYLNYATLVLAVPADAGKGKPAAGTATRDAYVWTGNVGSSWGSAGNWQDITAGGAAAIAPGQHDDVAVSSLDWTPTVITGVGSAHGLTLESTVDGQFGSSLLLVGRFAFHTLDGGGSVIEAGATSRIAVEVMQASNLNLQIEGGVLRAGYAEGGYWTLSGAAEVEVERAQSLYRVLLDSSSSFEIGTAGHAAAGKLTVDAGARLAGTWSILADVVDNGTIRVAQGGSDEIYGSLIGSGTALIDANSSLSVGGALSGVTIDFAGPDANLGIGTTVPAGFTIVDFRPGDYLTFSNLLFPVTLHAVFSGSGAGGGTLNFVDQNNSVETRIALLGDYSRDTFLVNQAFNTVGLSVLPPAASNGTAPIGTATPELYYSKTFRVGSWDDLANWSVSPYSTLTTVPGSEDDVELGINYGGSQLVLGVGAANTITASGTVVLDGRFTANLLTGNELTVGGQGSVLTVGTLQCTVTLDASTVRVGGEAQGGISLSQGAVMSVGSLALTSSISVDAQSSLVIGSSAASAALGTVTVASDGTISGGGTIESALRDDGQIVSYGLAVGGPVTGSGTLAINGYFGLTLSGSTASTITVALGGSDVPVFLADPHDMHATIAGFAASDTIDLNGILTAAQVQYSYLGNDFGQLALTDAGGATLDVLSLAGDYRGSVFTLTQDQGVGVRIGLAAGSSSHTT